MSNQNNSTQTDTSENNDFKDVLKELREHRLNQVEFNADTVANQAGVMTVLESHTKFIDRLIGIGEKMSVTIDTLAARVTALEKNQPTPPKPKLRVIDPAQ